MAAKLEPQYCFHIMFVTFRNLNFSLLFPWQLKEKRKQLFLKSTTEARQRAKQKRIEEELEREKQMKMEEEKRLYVCDSQA